MSYRIAFLPRAQKDFEEWKKTNNKTVDKIKEILRDIAEHPYSGIGKPEPLKHNLTDKWSRRINKAARIIYSVDGEIILVYIFSAANYGRNAGVSDRCFKTQINRLCVNISGVLTTLRQ